MLKRNEILPLSSHAGHVPVARGIQTAWLRFETPGPDMKAATWPTLIIIITQWLLRHIALVFCLFGVNPQYTLHVLILLRAT